MMNYAQGGQPHGLKSLAQDLRSYGRDGDTILAHINPQEAGILKALGGSGTINPDTGLPEYRFFKSVGNIVAAPFRAVNQVVKAIPVIGPAIDRGLVSLDKAVGNTIPGGWNTLAQTALAFTPLGLPAKVGLAALGGSGAFGKEGKFNFQKALLSGALAYGANQLTAGLQSAGGAGADATAGQIASNLGVEGASSAAGSQADLLAQQVAGFGDAGLKNIASSAGYNALPSSASNIAAQAIAENAPNAGMFEATSAPLTFDKSLATSVPQSLQMPSLSSMGTGTMENLSAAGRGIQNLTGFGTGAGTAASEFVKPVTTGGMTALAMGTMGLASLDEQEKALSQQYQQGQVNDDEYNRQMALIADGRRRAEEAMRANPYQFAMGGQVDDEMGGDYSAMGMDQGNLQKGLFGMGYAEGGTPRFLSGGGDGMSDSIPATINDKQPARLADGEFVIPADVVSHLGNGSSKAGAKRLYSMMDKVRQARTGKKQQAPEVNTKRLMPA
jgi:hypothetical protein